MAVKHHIIPPLTPQDLLRFWSHVRIRGPDDCWPWMAAHLPLGYGQFCLGSRRDGSRKKFYAHRVAWTIAHGSIPLGLCVCHTCDAPGCQNSRHLFAGSQKDNMLDKTQKKRGNPSRGDEHWLHKHPERILRGEQNGSAKLSEQDVREIRRRYAAGDITLLALAHEYGVSEAAIWRIVHRKTWAHVA